MNIQWYPGHMTKTRRMMQENISLVDIVIELLDARVPYSSKNPEIDKLAANKKRIIILNKSDLADVRKTEVWKNYFEKKGFAVITIDSRSGKGMEKVTTAARMLMKEKMDNARARGRIFMPIRAMIVGIPNVGKSTFINKYTGKASAKTGDKPGVTRSKQWIKIKKDFELLDTPGILWPKFDDKQVGLKLAFTGAINDEIIDIEQLAAEFINLISVENENALKERYKIDFDITDQPHKILEAIGIARGFKLKGGDVDTLRTAKILIDEYRGGKLGNLTLEIPEEIPPDL